ncbi:MAG: ASCH domain-containing protein [Gammaproteobacteria bacterium]|nr:ASCH domain-containing protein [Gammaproteobacteria bacterium]
MSMYIPTGPARPTLASLEEFWNQARIANPGIGLNSDSIHMAYQVRWIGLDAPTTQQIFELIRSGDKIGTFTLPWIIEQTNQATPMVGAYIILINFDGTPTQLVRMKKIYEVSFGKITAKDTAIDGSPVRDLAIWKPLHTAYWGALLKPFNLTVTEEMPVLVEIFELLFDRS